MMSLLLLFLCIFEAVESSFIWSGSGNLCLLVSNSTHRDQRDPIYVPRSIIYAKQNEPIRELDLTEDGQIGIPLTQLDSGTLLIIKNHDFNGEILNSDGVSVNVSDSITFVEMDQEDENTIYLFSKNQQTNQTVKNSDC